MSNNEIYKLIQDFLKDPPVVIWGSGATNAYGLPTMNDLNNNLKSLIPNFNTTDKNLEEELGDPKYEVHLSEIRKNIWNCIAEKDNEILMDMLENPIKYNGIKSLIEKFIEPHPHILNIITTNYDRVLENVLALNNFFYTDGFSGRLLSSFDEEAFSQSIKNKLVKLIKVHGSLNWFEINGETRYFNNIGTFEPKIVPPGKNKYQQTYYEPYRSLIQLSDNIIKKSKSLLVIGFGFNDEHLTPRITEQIKKGNPIVILAKKITESTKEQLKTAPCWLTLEKGTSVRTKISYKQTSTEKIVDEIDNSLWQLDKFMEAL